MSIIKFPDCGNPPKINKGTATLDDPGTSTFEATASITCTPGYETNKASISCQENGKWDKSKCTIKGINIIKSPSTSSVRNGVRYIMHL